VTLKDEMLMLAKTFKDISEEYERQIKSAPSEFFKEVDKAKSESFLRAAIMLEESINKFEGGS